MNNPWAGHTTGRDHAAMGNGLVGEGVVQAMAAVFLEAPQLDLEERLTRALEAGQQAGGEAQDATPHHSAALLVYHHALQKVGSLDPQKVRDAIAETDIMTFYGPIRFNEKGMNIAKGMAVVQLQNGKPVVVYPKSGAEAALVYPMPGSQ